MAPLRSLGNALSSFRDFYARTGTDALGSGGGTPVSATGGTKFTSGSFTYHIYTKSTPAPLSVSAGSEINVLVIGGGAGGQRDGGGGEVPVVWHMQKICQYHQEHLPYLLVRVRHIMIP